MREGSKHEAAAKAVQIGSMHMSFLGLTNAREARQAGRLAASALQAEIAKSKKQGLRMRRPLRSAMRPVPDRLFHERRMRCLIPQHSPRNRKALSRRSPRGPSADQLSPVDQLYPPKPM